MCRFQLPLIYLNQSPSERNLSVSAEGACYLSSILHKTTQEHCLEWTIETDCWALAAVRLILLDVESKDAVFRTSFELSLGTSDYVGLTMHARCTAFLPLPHIARPGFFPWFSPERGRDVPFSKELSEEIGLIPDAAAGCISNHHAIVKATLK